ncbi:MAG: chorismate-binding protein [Flavobacteriaceae bacterium]
MIFDKISTSYAQKTPFVSFRKPNENTIKGYFNTDVEIHYTSTLEEEGFVFAPFDDSNPSIIFLKETCEVIEEEIKDVETSKTETELETFFSDKESHIKLIKKGIEAIEEGEFKKVVLSRKEIVKTTHLEIEKIFKELLSTYNNAFVYVWFHPKVGLWMGATPERLITLSGGEFKTMALASTQPYQGNLDPDWGEKEKKEHQYVVDYIVSQIEDEGNEIVLDELAVSKTYTVKAGSLLHLKADIKGSAENIHLKKIVKALHPTPAVCGLPKKMAKDFILKHENYDRSFYTGFLGEINPKEETELFVNLRCVEFLDATKAVLYVGGGIVLGSDPEKEWQETLYKTRTIQDIL